METPSFLNKLNNIFGNFTQRILRKSKDKDPIRTHFNNTQSSTWNWVFYGDSITHGVAHTHGWRSFPEIFQERVRWELKKQADIIINTAYSGQTAYNLSKNDHFKKFVACYNPNVVFLLVGINDISLPNASIDKYKQNLNSIVRQIRKLGAIPIIQNYPPIAKSENLDYIRIYELLPKYNEVIKDIAKDNKAIFIDHWSYWKNNCKSLDSWLGETIHQGAQGHLAMAINIFKELGIYSEDSQCSKVLEITKDSL